MDIPTKLVVGLGNPGKEYEGTRHNVGFAVAQEFARRNSIAGTQRAFRGISGDGLVAGTRVFVLQPLTFMNLSGESVAAFLRQRPLPLTEIMVVTDDIALPIGRLRLRAGGSAGGHNGLKSIIAHLHSQDFPRLRVGVGAPNDPSVQIDFVLGRFSKREQAEIDESVDKAVAALETWVADGIERAMNQFNG